MTCQPQYRLRPGASPAEVALLVHWMTIIVLGEGVSDWERTFCASMIQGANQGDQEPSAKQIAVMRWIVRQFREANLRDDVIDDKDLT